jgi:hypothetical protein
MPRLKWTRHELVWQIESAVRQGFMQRIYTVLKTRGDDFWLKHATYLLPKFTVVVSGFEQINDESGERSIEMVGEIQVLLGDSDRGIHLKDPDLEFRPFVISVKDGRRLGVGDQPSLPSLVLILAELPTEKAVIHKKIAKIRFYRPLTGWEGFLLGQELKPFRLLGPKSRDLIEISMKWL